MKSSSWLILFILPAALVAQVPRYNHYEKFDVENGLPQNLVSGIVQDADGFIWVGTLDGLARFDGYDFLTFRHKPGDSNSLPFNSITSVIKDTENNLWVEFVNHSYCRVDPRTFKITQPKNKSIAQINLMPRSLPKMGQLHGFWGEEKNWFHFHTEETDADLKAELADTSNLKFQTFLLGNLSKRSNPICGFSEDPNGKLWLLTTTGLEVSDDQWENFTRIDFPVEFQLDAERIDFKPKLVHLNDHRIALVEGNKIVLYNSLTGELKNILTHNSNHSFINFSSTTHDVEGRLAFEYQNHIYRLEENETLTLLWKNPNNQGIRVIFIDRTNTLWVGTDPDGLYKINLLTPAFSSHLYQDDFISDVLINQVGASNKTITKDALTPTSAYNSRYTYAGNGNLVLSIMDGAFNSRIVELSGASLLTRYKHTTHGALATAPDGHIYFLEDNGTLRKWKNLSLPPELIHIKPTGTVNNDLLVDLDSYWVSTPQNGIFHFRSDTLVKVIRPYGNYASNVLSHDPNQPHILWIGTITGGLYKWDKVQDKLLASYTTENGLPNNTINSIVLGGKGCLWMSTNKGVTRFNPVHETFTNYSVADGLVESEFNRHHGLLLPNGQIAMGGTKGYSVFNPKDFMDDTYAPEVAVATVNINNKLIDHRLDSLILPAPINQLETIHLSYTNNSIGFKVTALQYNSPQKNKYRYQLEGYNKNWIESDGDRSIQFDLLPYGDYTLRLNATNTAGVWSPYVRSLAIVVHPPYWFSWWAYVGYTVIAGLVLRGFWVRYKNQLAIKQEAQFNAREAARLRELDETKNRFFSNITHEFRTPLTLILSPLEKHLNQPIEPDKAINLLKNNYRHARQLLKLVNQLLDIAKLEASEMHVNPSAGELKYFAEQCFKAFQEQAQLKNIAYTLSLENLTGHFLYDSEKWEKIIFNLLSNAIKFTPAKGSVHFLMMTSTDENTGATSIQIEVSDTGIGIDPELLPKIFERFYQVDDSTTRTQEGTGIGLALVKELIDLLGGEIKVDSSPGSGTIFRVQLPVERLNTVSHTKGGFTPTTPHREETAVEGIDHEVPVILVVEDNDELRSFIKESLGSQWTVLEASNGLHGWSILESELPEIVISDVMMPGMNGFELCKKSKTDLRTAHIGFIILTAKAAQESKIEGLESGADDYLTKPFHVYELELRIRNLLQEQDNVRKHLQERLLPQKPQVELPHVNDVFLNKLLAYVDEHLSTSEIDSQQIAIAMGMSKSTVNRKLKALLNLSLGDYIRQYRLQKAAVYLAAGNNVSEVAYRVGFETASYFSKCFKEYYQQTPTEFIRTTNNPKG